MQGYYQQPQMGGMGGGMGGMDPRMMGQGYGQQNMMGMQGMQGMQGMNGMQGMQGGMNPMMGGMGMGGVGMGNAWRQLGYDYQLPASGYKPDTSWGAWDLANAQYGGSGMDRNLFDTLLNRVQDFISDKRLSERAAKEAHRRVYVAGEGSESGSKTLGGAAAYQAYLLWDRDHGPAYSAYELEANKERFTGLAVGELFRLWNSVQPQSSRFSMDEANEHAVATASNLFERHYGRGNRSSGYFGDDDSDSGHRRRSHHGNMHNGGMMPGMMQQGMMPGQQQGMGMMGPGQGQGMGMGMYPQNQGMGMYGQGQGGTMNPMGMGGGQMGMGGGQLGMGMGDQMPMGMGMQPGMGQGQGGLAMGMIPMGGGMSIGESQAAPGMHPYTYGTQSGVAWGNQPIDQMGNPAYPGGRYGGGGGAGGAGHGGYGYGQPRYY